MHDFFYHGMWRMDWGFGNPNKTAALISTLMVASWSLTRFRQGFWAALTIFTGLGIGMIHTFSRGGIISVIAGLAPLIIYSQRPWGLSHVIGILAAVWVMIGVTFFLNAEDRYGQGVVTEDRSITDRLVVWSAAPRMMLDAPTGWGVGNSGHAYMEWYQPLNRGEAYRTLVNSHLTWLVEFGWPERLLYLIGWVSVFLLCWPTASFRSFSVALGIWISLAVSAIFSSVAESKWLWIVPGIALGLVLGKRLRVKIWPSLRSWGIPFMVSIVSLAILAALGRKGSHVRLIPGGVILGASPPDIYVSIDSQVMGRSYGHAVRRYLASDPALLSVAVIEPGKSIPSTQDKVVVLAGAKTVDQLLNSHLDQASHLILLNPSFFPQEIKQSKMESGRILVYFGEFSQSPALVAWKSQNTVSILPGVGDFLPQWPTLSFSAR